MITRDEAYKIVSDMVPNKNLVKHMLCVEASMQDYAERLGQDKYLWGITGLLHDADWEKFPDIHPKEIARMLTEMDAANPGYAPQEMIHAILAHGNGDRFLKRESMLDHYLYACDEVSGFVVACALVRPEKLTGMEVKSVVKRLKDKAFARGVHREDIYEGVAEINIPIEEHISNVIASVTRIRSELGI